MVFVFGDRLAGARETIMLFLCMLVVETVEKKREPMPAMEAIYLITPTVNSIRCLMSDFQVQQILFYR